LGAGGAEHTERLEAGARGAVLGPRVRSRDGEPEVACRVEAAAAGALAELGGRTAEETDLPRPDAPPDLDGLVDLGRRRRRSERDVQHAQRLEPMAEVPAAAVEPERMGVRAAHPGPQPPAIAAAAGRLVVDLEIPSRPEDVGRPPARSGRGGDPHAVLQPAAPVVAEGRDVALARAQLVLDGDGNRGEVGERADVRRCQPRGLELPTEERDGSRPDALERASEALELELAEPVVGERLDR